MYYILTRKAFRTEYVLMERRKNVDIDLNGGGWMPI